MMLRTRRRPLLRNHAARLRRLSNRLAKPGAVAIAAFTLLLGGTGTAHAAIYWGGVQMVDQATQQCLAAGDMGARIGQQGSTVPGCMAAGESWIQLLSSQPDSNGDANVEIQSWDYYAETAMCLSASATDVGPNGPNSRTTFWTYCDAQDADQIWAMQTAAPVQNVGNPAGLKHFINFYNAGENVCLDGGIGVYGFGGRCSTTNNWQIWNIYTNLTSSPYRG